MSGGINLLLGTFVRSGFDSRESTGNERRGGQSDTQRSPLTSGGALAPPALLYYVTISALNLKPDKVLGVQRITLPALIMSVYSISHSGLE